MTNTPEEWAYLAGIIDGEGYLSAGWNNKDGYVKGIGINVTSIDECLIDWLIEKFGGRKDYRGKTSSRNAAFRWHIERRELLRNILVNTLPYLVIKRRQAGVMLTLVDHLDNRPHLLYETPTSRANEVERKRRKIIRFIFNSRAKLLREGVKESRHCCPDHWARA